MRTGQLGTVYNTFAVEWSRKAMHWSMNGQRYGSAYSGNGTAGGWHSTGSGVGVDSPFDSPFHIILNLAVGGNFVGNPTVDAVSAALAGGPKDMLVDYVRVWGKNEP